MVQFLGVIIVKENDFGQTWRYLTNQEIPQYATVGIGNVSLETAANLWRGEAVSSLGDVTEVSVGPLKVTNFFGSEVNIANPFGTRISCVPMGGPGGGACTMYEPSELESYQIIADQLLNDAVNVEYVAGNLEAGALRALANGFTPTAFNSATWHLAGVQTDHEIAEFGWNPGGAVWILDNIPTALTVLDLTSSWNPSMDEQYIRHGR